MTSMQIGRGFTVTRRFSADPEDVFAAWTDPAQLGWFHSELNAPDDPIEVDLRVGGQWRQKMVLEMHGTWYWTGGQFLEIDPPRRLVFAWGAVGGFPDLDPEHPENCPIATVELAPDPDGTRMSFTLGFSDQLSDDQVRAMLDTKMELGWNLTIDRLQASLG